MKNINLKLDCLQKKFISIISSVEFKTAFITVFVVSMLANAFAYFNLYPQHDALNHAFNFAGNWEIRLGRFLLPTFGKIQGRITVPWLIGVASIILITLIVYLVCYILDLKRLWQIVIVACVFSANMSVTELTNVFIYVLAAYMLSVFFTCSAIFVYVHINSFWRYPVTIILFTISMGLYQAEIIFGIGLVAIMASKDLLENNKFSVVFTKYLKIGISVIVSVILYFGIHKIIMKIKNLEPASGYNSFSSLLNMNAHSLIRSVADSYWDFFSFFFGSDCYWGGTTGVLADFVLLFVAICLLILFIFKEKTYWYNKLFVLVIIFLFPGIVCIMDIIMNKNDLGFYYSYSVFLLYIFFIVIIDICKKMINNREIIKLGQRIIILCVAVITFQNILFSNQLYSYQKFMYDRALSITTRILNDIECYEGYEIGDTEVVIVGGLRQNKNLKSLNIPMPDTTLAGGRRLSITYNQTFKSFAWILGSDLNLNTSLEDEYKSNDIVVDMPEYPEKGYFQIIDDRMIIKLSQ